MTRRKISNDEDSVSASRSVEHWEEVIPHREDVLIDYVDTFKNYLVLYERRNGLRQIRISAFGWQYQCALYRIPRTSI